MVKYRTLHAEEICRELFKDFIRHQIVENAGAGKMKPGKLKMRRL